LSHSASGIGNLDSLSCIAISVSPSRLLYALKLSHLFGSCSFRFLVRLPFVFVGLQRIEQKRIKSLPSDSFCLSALVTIAAPSKDSGKPKYADHTIVHRQSTGDKSRLKCLLKQIRSN